MNHQACENPMPPAAPAPVLSEESADAFAWSMLIELVGHGLAGRAAHAPHAARPARPAAPPAHAPHAAHAASADAGREAGER
ncbi:hypothetical protein OG739_29265 [Streptomyces longwoodensis]|uniref:hypothetical protein n=1 Tax=Streptomyces longwoodensis TaxID=68231 RepID=UPI00225A6E19|nr:hypothetical protein [Streptomyces longwoodensis]MCX4996793.1 hypothetical protein [Streptomyces longwoodensis]WTI44246.1 hypothetical protein OG547_06875 [Streptomyces longwoodensis]